MPLPDINLSSLLVILFGGGGIIGGLVAFLRYRSDTEKTIVESAQTTVEAQALVLKNLQKEIIRLGQVITDREKKIEELTARIEESILKAKAEVIAAIPNGH